MFHPQSEAGFSLEKKKRLYLMILKVFFNIKDSMILWFCD